MLKSSIAKRLLLAGAAGLLMSAPASAQLESALNTAKASTSASAASQQRVERLDDEADTAVREFRAVLQQKDNIALFVAQQDIFLQSQKSEIASLRRQLGTVEQIKQGMSPMMLKMAAEIEDAIKADMPFNMAERLARVERMKNTLSDPNVSPAEQYRQVLNAFKIEVSYGQGIDSYEGMHPTKPGNVVNFLRFGRVSLVYMTKDESEVGRYNLDTKSWDVLSGADALALRKAIRISRGEAAPDVVFAPVSVSN
ncbi:DUF3450 domain-containing protein [Hellea balneolensis]|uniref:DUF3450 domain-containing protein n=1 Tax=Hellea balneolensis TaxID=287478 RepID=UPI00040E0581|nr:DUF3450 domain-containing protein [Hellea balneolensis]